MTRRPPWLGPGAEQAEVTRPFFAPQPDAYDVMVRELGFEMKAQPSSRMKSEAELAREAQARLQRLEVRRVPGAAAACLWGAARFPPRSLLAH